MLPPHMVGPGVGPDPGPQGHGQGGRMGDDNNGPNAQHRLRQQGGRPPVPPAAGINPVPQQHLKGYRDAAVARVDALYQSALENIERQSRQLELVQVRLQARGGEGVARDAFNANQLEALIQSCESNRRLIAGLLNGDE